MHCNIKVNKGCKYFGCSWSRFIFLSVPLSAASAPLYFCSGSHPGNIIFGFTKCCTNLPQQQYLAAEMCGHSKMLMQRLCCGFNSYIKECNFLLPRCCNVAYIKIMTNLVPYKLSNKLSILLLIG